MGLLGAAIGTYRPQYRPLSAIRYLDANPLSSRYTLFSTLHTRNMLTLVTRDSCPAEPRPVLVVLMMMVFARCRGCWC
jgi:hypothetical protein